ncbi:MAG: alpha-L-rhamnosidase, partial [Myxococcota bacterium]|nr:alpha-L-rhamnosidase [Myxococcota bacterium]
PWPADDGGRPQAPTGLLCELLTHPETTTLSDPSPELGWIVPSRQPSDHQTAYRVLVASRADSLARDTGDMWDSGKVVDASSINVPYAGKPLTAGASYAWKVQTWDAADQASPWSASQTFVMAPTLGAYATPTEPTVQIRIAPAKLATTGPGHYFADFGRDAFGWVELTVDSPTSGVVIQVSLGEKANGQAVDMAPGASVRSAQVQLTLQQGPHTYRVATPPNALNTKSPPAVLVAPALGVVMPFRYVELANVPVAPSSGPGMVTQVAVRYPSDDSASYFRSSDATLDQVWELSKYSVIAPTFAGIYIDGDRERTPYEGDAYIQQLGHYGIDREFALARYSHEFLLFHPTWPTEWKQHSVMMAWTDWMYTGNTESLAQYYALLSMQKTLEGYAGADGLLDTTGLRDLVDWPTGERDGFVMTSVNTVVNAFWCHNLQQMADMADALGRSADGTRYRSMAATALASFNAKLSDASTGLYVDGLGVVHSSLHANMIPLAFGLVPADRKARVTAFVKSRGMACSVYGAQYLLEALYQAGEPDAALALMTSATDRSWTNMLRVGATITLEAWDAKYKPNLDWNHAWGAAPANIVGRYLLGVKPLAPGFAKAGLQPQLGSLSHAEGLVPTIRGPIHVVLDHAAGQRFTMGFSIPANMTADVALPALPSSPCNATLDGVVPQTASRGGTSWIDAVGSGAHVLVCQ